jgi:hypothetical protein
MLLGVNSIYDVYTTLCTVYVHGAQYRKKPYGIVMTTECSQPKATLITLIPMKHRH